MQENRRIVRKLFKFAKANCCNYLGTFNGKPDYCPYERECVVKNGEPCKWFERAILPLDINLLDEYLKLYGIIREPIKEKANRCRDCGATLKSKRKRYCEKCARKRKRASNKKAIKKYRSGCKKIQIFA